MPVRRDSGPDSYVVSAGPAARVAVGWMEIAAEQACLATCRQARCGAIITQGDLIIGRGFNHPPGHLEGQRMCGAERGLGKPGYDSTCCVHAEWAAIMDARRATDFVATTLWFTRVDAEGSLLLSGPPFCTVCSRLALDCGIEWFALWHPTGITKYRTDYYNKLSYAYRHPTR